MREDQAEVLRWALELARGHPVPVPSLPEDRLRGALLATGLAAGAAEATVRLGIPTTPSLAGHLVEQRDAVRVRFHQYLTLAPRVLAALAAAGVRATPVKGIVLAAHGIWPFPDTRPMSDIDLLVPPEHLPKARAVMAELGMHRSSATVTEEVFLAWGDGSPGRRDGESAAHNGKVELHPGWAEFVHGYAIGDARLLDRAAEGPLLGAPAHLLTPPDLVVHVLGHLSAAVIRREVRALHALDVVFSLAHLEPSERVELAERLPTLDHRLWHPALWFVHGFAPAETADLVATLPPLEPRHAALLATARPSAVLRDPMERTPWAWRSGWAAGSRERVAAAREQLLPPIEQLRGNDSTSSAFELHRARLARSVRRAFQSRRSG